MKIENIEINKYRCEYCNCLHESSGRMESHEEAHRKVEELEIGQEVVYNFDSGYTRRGKVVKKNVLETKFLVDAGNEERNWTSFYNAKIV